MLPLSRLVGIGGMAMALAGCAWAPRFITYPDGLRVAQVDQFTLDNICSKTNDAGLPLTRAVGCYSKASDTIYVRADCEGAKALTHELAHRHGVANPSKAGYDW